MERRNLERGRYNAVGEKGCGHITSDESQSKDVASPCDHPVTEGAAL